MTEPTIYDVADEAGVSVATVSRAMNDMENVSAATQERVMATVQELSYRPSRTAKSLAQPSISTITVAAPTFTTPFHNELLKGVRNRLVEVDIDLLLCDLDWEAPQRTLREFLSRGMVDGLLLVGVAVDEAIASELERTGAPVVLVGTDCPTFDSFHWNTEHGARQATEHLLEHRHDHVGMIVSPFSRPQRTRRLRGYRAAVEATGRSFTPSLVVHAHPDEQNGHSEEAGYEAMKELLRAHPPVSGVFASSDMLAIGAWRALRESGRQVPGDCALVGYGDIKVSRYIGLSSVAQRMQSVGHDATDQLIGRLGEEDGEVVSESITPELLIRPSSISQSDSQHATAPIR